MRLYLFFTLIVLAMACNGTPSKPGNANVNTPKPASDIPVFSFEKVKEYPHDPRAFTQGLVFHEGFLYESTGEYGESNLRKVDLETGKILKRHDLARDFFGEGMTILNGRIYQITWRERTAFVYDLSDFTLLKEFRYQGEGWGLTNDGTNLIMSDGTHVIRFIDPENFETMRTIVVMFGGRPLMNLNELEYVKGEIWANVWHSETIGKPNHIARIDPKSGKLLGWVNLDGISPDDVARGDENTLNGIAYDPASDRLFVTGKRWRKLFEIKIKEN